MCFSYDAQPPELPSHLRLAPLAGGAAAEHLNLTSADGTAFSAAIAETPVAEARTGIVILPDVRGLYPFYERLAERFAEAGHHAIVVDYFGRTAGLGPRDDEFEFWPHTVATEEETIQSDVKAAVEALGQRTGATIFITVGFCFGGSNSYLCATNGALGLSGAVAFYGGLDTAARGMKIPSPVDKAAETKVPVLGLFGGGDEGIPQARIDELKQGLDQSGVQYEIHVYPGAPHSFFDRTYEQYSEESADAWQRVLDFVDRVSHAAAVT
jgi:carboxymethylenebutenolidase